ncbi:MAG TPA: hypothetical protein VJ998_02050 [Pseudomonadales bacterium]|nr:hypothetical protein [Pseudomonadales bacterium]
MKKFLVFAVLALTANWASAAQQFTVSGTIDSVQDASGQKTSGGTFDAVIKYDSSKQPTMSTGSFGTVTGWYSSITSVTYHVRDASGNQILSQDVLATSSGTTGFVYDVTVAKQTSSSQVLQWILYNSSDGTLNYAMIAFDDSTMKLFSSLSDYPDISMLRGHSGTFSFNSKDSSHSLQGSGTITSVSFGSDSDGDGISDDMDSCPHSDLSPTVVINGHDSGVKNTLQPDGCTLVDMFGGDTSSSNVAHVTNQMRKDGLISGRDKGAIQSAAGGSR